MRALFGVFTVALACSPGVGDSSPLPKSPSTPFVSTDLGSKVEVHSFLRIAMKQEMICLSEREECRNGCDDDMIAGAAACGALGFTSQAAACHSSNMARYAGCLLGCG